MKTLLNLFRILILALTAGQAFAANDITVTFQKTLIDSKLKGAIADQFKNVINEIRDTYDPGLPDIRVQVQPLQLSRVDAYTLRVRANIDAIALTGDVNDVLKSEMSFVVRFGCSGLNLDIPFTLEALSIASLPYPVEDIQRRVNEKIRTLEARLKETLQRELPPPSRLRCPRIEVRSDLSIVMTVDLAPLQCTPPQTRHENCSRYQWGDGILYSCANGYWKQQSRMCESCADSPHPSCPRRPRREF